MSAYTCIFLLLHDGQTASLNKTLLNRLRNFITESEDLISVRAHMNHGPSGFIAKYQRKQKGEDNFRYWITEKQKDDRHN